MVKSIDFYKLRQAAAYATFYDKMSIRKAAKTFRLTKNQVEYWFFVNLKVFAAFLIDILS